MMIQGVSIGDMVNQLVALRDALKAADGDAIATSQSDLLSSEDLLVSALADNGAVLLEQPADVSLPAEVAPGKTVQLPVTVQPPKLPPGADTGKFEFRVDLFDTAADTWFSAMGNEALVHPVTIAKDARDMLGLERFWHYDSEDLGAGMTSLTNVANGNVMLRWSPFFAPGRGLATTVDLTYNSLEDHSKSPAGHNFSLSVSGLVRLGERLEVKGLLFARGVELVDGDGTRHRFDRKTDSSGKAYWQEPAGVNLYLREIRTNPADRRWAVTRPDAVTYWFNDDGYPTAPHYTDAEFAALSGATTARITRLEPIMERVLPAASTPGDARARLLACLDELGDDTVALKSAIAYRTGLSITTWGPDEIGASFDQARRDAARNEGRLRLHHRPIHEHLLRAALHWAAVNRLPVQFHTGYGDPDLDLRLANPLHLRPLLEDPDLHGLHLVLLHGCWPYTREGAFLAAVYEGVFLDVSYAIPFLSTAELRAMTRAALAAAPATKLLYSSDGVTVPELHWTGAHTARRIVGAVLAEAVADADLTPEEAERTAHAFLHGNARGLYGL